ncbi:hypothetical protein, partial [Plasmodium yoelii yoelii]
TNFITNFITNYIFFIQINSF